MQVGARRMDGLQHLVPVYLVLNDADVLAYGRHRRAVHQGLGTHSEQMGIGLERGHLTSLTLGYFLDSDVPEAQFRDRTDEVGANGLDLGLPLCEAEGDVQLMNYSRVTLCCLMPLLAKEDLLRLDAGDRELGPCDGPVRLRRLLGSVCLTRMGLFDPLSMSTQLIRDSQRPPIFDSLRVWKTPVVRRRSHLTKHEIVVDLPSLMVIANEFRNM